jgi:hypothetical protein
MKFPKDPNNLDWGSLSKAEFKRAELHYELRDEEEDNSWEIYEVWIDGKMWKDFGYKRNQAVKAAQTLRDKGVQAFAKVRRY